MRSARSRSGSQASPQADSAIVAVILEDQEQAVLMWQALLEAGLYVNVARPPAT